MGTATKLPENVEIEGSVDSKFEDILTPEALEFVAKITRQFRDRRNEILEERKKQQKRFDDGEKPDFRPETEDIREGDWTVDPVPEELQDRRVEITGPSSQRNMVVNAFNSGAEVYMTDFEDSDSPTWNNVLQGQLNLYQATRNELEFTSSGKEYSLDGPIGSDEVASLKVRPRGFHLDEKHIIVDGEPVPGSFVDFGLFFFHNAEKLVEQGSGPYFYLPKLEQYEGARLWNDIFVMAQDELGIEQGTIKATVLVETITAVFQTHEILYELKEHAAGLNCGRWDYMFSFIKKFRNQNEFLIPNRNQLQMTVHFLRSYAKRVVQTCHERGIHALGGMASQIPVKDNPELNEENMNAVREDKEREVKDGHDGTWVAHPDLVEVAREVFDEHMPQDNQIDDVKHEDLEITQEDLLAVPDGTITEEGLRTNVHVGLQYMGAWLAGNGCVPIYNNMEDAATAEISRTQVWHWIHHPQGTLEDGRDIDEDLFETVLEEEHENLREKLGEELYQTGRFDLAEDLYRELATSDEFIEFLTLPGYEYLD
ncbi:MAG: malate synthase A [bacterium]